MLWKPLLLTVSVFLDYSLNNEKGFNLLKGYGIILEVSHWFLLLAPEKNCLEAKSCCILFPFHPQPTRKKTTWKRPCQFELGKHGLARQQQALVEQQQQNKSLGS